MKTETCLNLTNAVVTALLVFASFGLAVPAAAQDHPVASKKALKVLLRTAQLPSEHRRIAQSCRQEPTKYSARSADRLRDAAIYNGSPPYPAMQPQHWAMRHNGPAHHCRAYAKSDAKKARKFEAELCCSNT